MEGMFEVHVQLVRSTVVQGPLHVRSTGFAFHGEGLLFDSVYCPHLCDNLYSCYGRKYPTLYLYIRDVK